MKRLAKYILLAMFATVLFEMCRDFASRTNRVFGLVVIDSDWIFYGGIGILGMLIFLTWLTQRQQIRIKH